MVRIITIGILVLFTLAGGCVAREPYTLQPLAPPRIVADAGKPYELRIMSINVRQDTLLDVFNSWSRRKVLVAESIRRFDADVVGTQELEPHQARDLQELLPGYELVGTGRDNGKGGEMCGVLYKAVAFYKLSEGTFWLSEEPYKPGTKGWGARYPRLVTGVRLQPKIPNAPPFYFFNTHLDHASSSARDQGSRFLRTVMSESANGEPAIVVGDFNDGENSRPYRNMLAERPPSNRTYDFLWNPLSDSYRVAHPERARREGTHHGFWGGTGGKRIDWILCSKQFRILTASIDRTETKDKYPTDHYPVTAVVRWQP